MDKTQKEKAEKLQTKLDKLLETREKKQTVFDKTKRELNTVTKEIESVKLKLFEILQSGSDDTAFSSWAKRKINENAKTGESENCGSVNSEESETLNTQKQKPHTGTNPQTQNPQSDTGQNQPAHMAQREYRPDNHSGK